MYKVAFKLVDGIFYSYEQKTTFDELSKDFPDLSNEVCNGKIHRLDYFNGELIVCFVCSSEELLKSYYQAIMTGIHFERLFEHTSQIYAEKAKNGGGSSGSEVDKLQIKNELNNFLKND